MFKVSLFSVLALLLSYPCVFGQDPHLSQFYHAPLSLNPAMTGLMNHDIRLSANYRAQWTSVTTPFQTIDASADASILAGPNSDDFFGVGLSLTNDKAGDTDLKATGVHLSAAYSKALTADAEHFISLGGKFGMVNRSINYSTLTFDSQFDGETINGSLNSGEQLERPQFTFLDFAAGISWFYASNSQTKMYAGASLAHINEPDQRFLSGERENLYRKWTFHIGGEIGLNDELSVIPRSEFLLQGPHKELNVGALLKYNLTPDLLPEEGGMSFQIGTTHRWRDAQIAIVRFDYLQLGFSFSYDFNVSGLSNASHGLGGPEIAVIYKTNLWQADRRAKRGAVHCP